MFPLEATLKSSMCFAKIPKAKFWSTFLIKSETCSKIINCFLVFVCLTLLLLLLSFFVPDNSFPFSKSHITLLQVPIWVPSKICLHLHQGERSLSNLTSVQILVFGVSASKKLYFLVQRVLSVHRLQTQLHLKAVRVTQMSEVHQM